MLNPAHNAPLSHLKSDLSQRINAVWLVVADLPDVDETERRLLFECGLRLMVHADIEHYDLDEAARQIAAMLGVYGGAKAKSGKQS